MGVRGHDTSFWHLSLFLPFKLYAIQTFEKFLAAYEKKNNLPAPIEKFRAAKHKQFLRKLWKINQHAGKMGEWGGPDKSD